MAVPMSLITAPRVLMHSTSMVVVWWTIRSNKLSIFTLTVRHPNAVITILITTVSHVILYTVHSIVSVSVSMIVSMSVSMAMAILWGGEYPIQMNAPVDPTCTCTQWYK